MINNFILYNIILDMENLYAIVISDFNEKLHFLHKKSNFELEQVLKITKSLNKNLNTNYLQEYLSNQYEYRLMDTLINSELKVKLSLLGEITVIIIYEANVDLHLINLINQRMIESFYLLCRTKKIRVDMLLKRYNETNLLLEDTLQMLDPKIRMALKPGENMITKDMVHVKIK
jgi:hypothetical protein